MLQFFDDLRDWRRKRSMPASQALGHRGEDLAHRYLQRRGYTVVGRNYRATSGMAELDIIAWESGKLVFVEVKTRATADYGPPDRAISDEKRVRLFRGAREYARRAGVDWQNTRFDIVGVVLSDPPEFSHFHDVFPLSAALQ